MVDPGIALLWFGGVVLALAVVFWPRRGVVALVRRFRRQTERVELEDALKTVHNAEYVGQACTVDALAGALQVSRSRALSLASRLEARGLVKSEGGLLELTEGGLSYARRVLRTHRLWERYLADRTGVAPTEWHEEAERQEHALTLGETERLAERLGHPVYDPHGDPIPTAEGEIPPLAGVPLTRLSEGEAGVVVHMEDEPPEAYDALVQAGFALRMRVEVLGTDASGLEWEASGRRGRLDRLVAANVTVVPVAEAREPRVAWRTLVDLAPGATGTVVGLSPACRGPQRRRLLDLGVVPGTRIRAELRSASGDPVAFRIRGALIALRREQASWIRIEDEAGEEEAA